jgi:hypothetical protein
MSSNHVLLETIELTQSASSFVFDNIPQTGGYTDLKVVFSTRTNLAGGPFYFDDLALRINGDTGNNYVRQSFRYRDTVGTTSSRINPASWIDLYSGNAGDATANTFAVGEFYIPNYRVSSSKTVSGDGFSETNGAQVQGGLLSGLWNQTAAITSLSIFSLNSTSFVPGSTASLYGVAGAGTTPTVAPKATGGNIVASDGTYWYHAFVSSGTFTPQANLTCDYLVVAGGGGASRYGGGGAGGYRTASESLTASSYAVTIGAGGATTYANVQGNNGTASTFSSITSAGGGGGGSLGATGPGLAGGSGGGGGSDGTYAGGAGNTPSTSPAQGFAGGSGTAAHPYYVGGGGGGATTVGANGSGFTGGNGGTGSNALSAWASATSTGVSGYYAGGGGGVGYNYPGTGVGGAGGAGGGGAGRSIGDGSQTPVPGVANTGGGGGGGWNSSGLGSNAGGSGIVIIRYPMA